MLSSAGHKTCQSLSVGQKALCFVTDPTRFGDAVEENSFLVTDRIFAIKAEPVLKLSNHLCKYTCKQINK